MRIKDLSFILVKWQRNVNAATADYTNGVKNPRADWAEATAAAKNTYAQGVTAAIANDSFSKGVAKAGTAKWQNNTINLGPTRWTQGVAAAAGAFRNGYAPYRAILNDLTLPERGPAGSPQNLERVRVISEALHNYKVTGAQ